MALSTEDAADLVSLQAAYRKLIRGEQVAKVVSGGRTVEYAQADLARLKAEIEKLEAAAAATSTRPAATRGTIQFRVG